MVSSFDPHSMCAKVERIMAKTGCTSCTNWTISFKVRGFQTKTNVFQRHFIFLNLFQLKTFFASDMQHSKPHTKIRVLLPDWLDPTAQKPDPTTHKRLKETRDPCASS